MHPYRRVPLLSAAAILFVVAAAIAGPPGTASAHRDGCHRWHSCPSDTGSYVCGDLGYYSECPGGAPGSRDPYVAPDVDAPATPRITSPAPGPGGLVRVSVRAEAGSRIVVREGAREVRRVRATGATQLVTFRAADGLHAYSVTATDAAGNVSGASGDFTVTTDRTPPVLGALTAQAGTPESEASVLRFTTDPLTAFTVSVPGEAVATGGRADGDGAAEAVLWLRNGRHTATVSVRDEAGNVRQARAAVRVDVAAPALGLRRTSDDGATPVLFEVTAPPRSTGTLAVGSGEPVTYRLDETATSAVLSVPLSEGRYAAPHATVTDWAGRRAQATAAAFVVDTTSPRLGVVRDAAAAAHGRIRVAVTAEEGAAVVLAAGRAGTEEFVADGAAHEVTLDAEDGSYPVTVTATDPFGNRSERTMRVRVTHPATAGEILAGLLCLALVLGLPLGAGIVLWRRRGRIGAWLARRRSAAEHRTARLRYDAEVRAHQETLRRHHDAGARYAADHRAWEGRRAALAALLGTAEHERGAVPSNPSLKLRRGERVYAEFPGGMLELRRPRGVDEWQVVQNGTVTLTGERIVFTGQSRREWAFEKLVALHHPAPGHTHLTVANRQNPSGIAYGGPDPDRIRLLVDLAAADCAGRREDVVAAARRALAQHDGAEPPPPPPPPPAPRPPEPVSPGVSAAGGR
ncbi:MAG TPA: hypothetical protein VGP02_19450 [Mycobacteriales bacterium]|nr:hypothetical protein [Mycobacteriales bacterium]